MHEEHRRNKYKHRRFFRTNSLSASLSEEELIQQIQLKEAELHHLLSGIDRIDRQGLKAPRSGVWKIRSQSLDGKPIPAGEWIIPSTRPKQKGNVLVFKETKQDESSSGQAVLNTSHVLPQEINDVVKVVQESQKILPSETDLDQLLPAPLSDQTELDVNTLMDIEWNMESLLEVAKPQNIKQNAVSGTEDSEPQGHVNLNIDIGGNASSDTGKKDGDRVQQGTESCSHTGLDWHMDGNQN